MLVCKPVTVPKGAFLFCKYALTILMWAAVIFRNKELAVVTMILLAMSAVFKVSNAPLVWFYRHTVERVWPSGGEVLDENGMCFAHGFGAVINLVSVIFLYVINAPAGWAILFVLAVIKTLGTLGFCPASKLYGCLASGGCCRFTGKHHGC